MTLSLMPGCVRASQSWLGIAIMLLVVAYHYVTADPKYEASRQ